MTLYAYVGSARVLDAVVGQPAGAPIASKEALVAWLAANPDALREGATWVIDRAGVLRLAPRRSEHVACAGDTVVRAAGEMEFARDGAVLRVSNQSSGFCPEVTTFALLDATLSAIGVKHPEGYDPACEWRRCEACAQLVLVKDDDYACPCCDADLPRVWNLGSATR